MEFFHPPEQDLSKESLTFANRWPKLKVLHHSFARRWKDNYLFELHKSDEFFVIRQDDSADSLEYEWPMFELPMAF